MWRAALELVGAAKKSVLFEEAFAMRLVRLLRQTIEEHPFVVATKSEATLQDRPAYQAHVVVRSMMERSAPSATVRVEVEVTNAGNLTWRARPRSEADTGYVRIGIQLLDRSMRLIARDFSRAELDGDVLAGASRTERISFNAPAEPGEYFVKFDLVAEGVTWFEAAGSSVEIRPLIVA
jgi:hypothetical protein